MKVISPTTITPAMLVSSTAAEPSGSDPAAWNSGTAYVAGDYCHLASTHKVYYCLVANTNFSPDVNLTGATPKWLEYSATNRWKMFDEEVDSVTAATSPLTVVIKPGQVTGLSLLGLSGTAASVSMKDQTGGSVVYTASKSLDGTIITDWYDYFFEPYAQLDSWVLTDLQPYSACEITVSVTGTGTVSAGVLTAGTVYDLGTTLAGVTVGIADYSTKTTDLYGRTTIVPRKYAKTMDARLHLNSTQLNKVQRLLASLRTTPCVWIGSSLDVYAPTVIYGFYKDFSLEIPYADMTMCSLQIEGLT